MKLFEKLSIFIRQGTQVFLLIAVIILFCFPVYADDCEKCKRAAVVTKCENPDLPPDHDKLYKVYEDCISQHMNDNNWEYDNSDPKFRAAHKACKHLRPEFDFIYATSISNRIAELHTTPCFHILRSDIVEDYRKRGQSEGWGDLIKPLNYKIPEYAFEVVFRNSVTGEKDEHGKLAKSTLTIALYYDGDERELVKTWRTVGSLPWINSHYQRMFKNADAQMRQEKPIQNLLWQFEQTPIECKISPKEISVKKNETREIILTDFNGQNGPSKPFNRVVVKVEEGEILNGEELSSDSKARVFKVGNGIISVNYKAPDTCKNDEDTINVYNSCDIAKEALVPLSESKIKDKIAEKIIEIECEWEWTGVIQFKRKTNINLSGPVEGGHGKCKRKIKCDLNIKCKLKTVYYNKRKKKIKCKGNITAPFTLSANFRNESTDQDGHTFITDILFPNFTDTIKSSYDPVKKQSGGVTLNIYKDSMEYELSLLLSTKCMGTTTMVSPMGEKKEPYEWSIKIIKEFKGKTNGKTITGTWTGPPCKYKNVTECWILWPYIPYIFGGKECGTTWTWNLKRIK